MKLEHGAEIIIINDGSEDNSKKIMRKIEIYTTILSVTKKIAVKVLLLERVLKNQKENILLFKMLTWNMNLEILSNFWK